MRRRLDLPPDAILIGGVANGGVLANPWKGGRFVLETIAALQESHPDAWFVNIGAHARSEHPRVIDLPRVTDEGQLAALFSMLDVYLFPSIAENFPLVTLEAMACGIPVVAFATGGVPEQIRDGQDGVIAPYGDGEALIDGLRRLLANSEARTRFGRSARERAEREFDHRRIEDRYLAAYAETAAGHGAAGRSPSMLVPDWVRKAQEGRSAGMLSGAEGLLRLALELDPDHGAAVLALSELLAENGLLEEALRLLESAARRMVGDREVWKHLGVYRFHAGNAPGAMDALLRAQELDPGDLDTLISLGDMALGEGQDQRAREWFQQACDAHPDETDAWAGLAMACRRLRENRALALAQERLRVLAPDHPALKP